MIMGTVIIGNFSIVYRDTQLIYIDFDLNIPLFKHVFFLTRCQLLFYFLLSLYKNKSIFYKIKSSNILINPEKEILLIFNKNVPKLIKKFNSFT